MTIRVCINFPMRAVKHFPRWIGDHGFADVGRCVEESGFDGIAVSEHPMPDRAWLAEGGHHAFDPFVALAAWGAVTRRITLMTAIAVTGYRHPYVTGKAASTLDVATRGRFVLGLGAGYLKAEFEVLGADFAHRGALFDEAIEALRASWRGDDFDGPTYPLHGHESLPRPTSPDGPPIWVGGNSRAARRRAVTLADGWTPIAQDEGMAAITGTPALTDTATLAEQIGEVQAARREAGRADADIAFTPFEKAALREGAAPFGTAVKRALGAYEDAGVTWLVIEPLSRSFGDFEADLERIAEALA